MKHPFKVGVLRGEGCPILLNERTIWSYRQNIPELVVQDCIKEFGLSEEQAEKLRMILLVRGVNKWLYARRKFLDLKHKTKAMLKEAMERGDKKEIRTIEKIYVPMQNIARLPRWIEWPKTVTRNWKKIEEEIVIKGRHC